LCPAGRVAWLDGESKRDIVNSESYSLVYINVYAYSCLNIGRLVELSDDLIVDCGRTAV